MVDSVKIKILYIITKSNFGGAQRYVYDLATKLPRDSFDVTVAMGGDGVLKDKLNEAGIKTIKINKLGRDISIFDDITVFFNLFNLFRKEKPDVVHLNSSKIGGLGALAARIALVPRIIFTAHGWAFNEARNILQRITIKILSWFTVFFCHSVIAVSEHDGRQGRVLPFVGKKITVIHNGVSKIDFKDRKEARNHLLGSRTTKLDEKTVWLGTIAELHKNKGLEYAIKALANISKIGPWKTGAFVFVVIGDGEQRENLKNLVKEEGLKKNIFLVGHKEDASTLLKAFDLFLLPSIKEGFPYVLLEAGIAGVPIVASDVGGIPEIIDDMETGILVRTKNTEEIKKAILYFIENGKKMSEFGQKLHKKVTKMFSTEQMLEKTMQIYQI